jgi:rubrerythrin
MKGDPHVFASFRERFTGKNLSGRRERGWPLAQGNPEDELEPEHEEVLMKPRTKDNVHKAFIGEAKAYFRLLAYAQKADEEDVPQVALLFRAIAEAERVHANRQMNLVKDLIVKDTDTNLENSFQREKSISENEYPDFLKIAEEEGETAAALAFSHARDAEGFHAKLYERAIMNIIKDKVKEYHVCQVCGYVTDKKIPKRCPVCGAPPEKFKTIDS